MQGVPVPGASYHKYEEGIGDSSSTWYIEASRTDNAYLEFVAGKICQATEDWRVCEVWRSEKNVLKPNSPRLKEDTISRLRLRLGVFNDDGRRECFSRMQAPNGHACPRCLQQNPIASFMRHSCGATFTPGIGLVGRAWLLRTAEMVDIPTAERSTYARAKHAANAGLFSALAIPVVTRPTVSPRRHLSTDGPLPQDSAGTAISSTVPLAVIILYLGHRLMSTIDEKISPSGQMLSPMAAMLVSQGTPTSSSTSSSYSVNSSDNVLATSTLARCVAVGNQAAQTGPSLLHTSHRRSLDTRTTATDCQLANKLSNPTNTSRAVSRLFPCPICFDTIDHAVSIRACAHNACAECLKRWRVLSPDCPACGGLIDLVFPDPELDEHIAEEVTFAAEEARKHFFDEDGSDDSVYSDVDMEHSDDDDDNDIYSE